MFPGITSAIMANKRLFIVLLVFAAVPLLIKVAGPSAAQSPEGAVQSPESASQERKFKLKEGIGVPLEVKVRNLQSETWPKDLEIEVKNIGKKPIYSIVAYLNLPDEKWAEHVGIPLAYGNPKNENLDRLAEAEDPHIDPGASYILRIDDDLQKGLERRIKESPQIHKRFELWFARISFGDGTGLVNGGERDHRKKALIRSTLDGKNCRRFTGITCCIETRLRFLTEENSHAC